MGRRSVITISSDHATSTVMMMTLPYVCIHKNGNITGQVPQEGAGPKACFEESSLLGLCSKILVLESCAKTLKLQLYVTLVVEEKGGATYVHKDFNNFQTTYGTLVSMG